MQEHIHISLFKLAGCDFSLTRTTISSTFEPTHTYTLDGHSSASPIELEGLALTAWAILLEGFLATSFISFASSHVEHSPSMLTHSLDVNGDDRICDVVNRIQAPMTQRQFDPSFLGFHNTLLEYHIGATPLRHEATNEGTDIYLEKKKFDIRMKVSDERGVLCLSIDLSSQGRFAKAAAKRLLFTYHNILKRISNGGAFQTVRALNLLTAYDVHQILKWNSKPLRRRNACVHNVFEQQVQRHSEASAVCSWDGNLTYGELNKLSNKLAHHLGQMGVGPEVFVPYAFEKSKYAVIATLAVLKAGGAFVPLEFTHPRKRLESIVNRVGATLILASVKTAKKLQGLAPTVLIIDGPLLENLLEKEQNPNSGVSSNNSAFMLFTSGSTGEPKGLIQEHTSVCTVNEAYGESLFINDQSRVLNFAAYTFDVSTVDVFTTLYLGGCICIPSEDERLNDLMGAIRRYQVNWVDLTPSFAMASIQNPHNVPSLKTLVLAGEEVKQEHVSHFVGKIDRVINCYGPAEAGGCLANVYRSTASEPQTIGTALKSARCWIADVKDCHRLAPIGAVGELILEGPTLAREYYKDRRKTDAAFFYHVGWSGTKPWDHPRRMYRTGDLIRYRPNGTIDFVGRQDTQVKVRGQRVELREIEQHLSDAASIRRSVVAFPRSGPWSKRLVVVVEPCLDHDVERFQRLRGPLELITNMDLMERGFALNPIKEMLASKVPAYMMPASWLAVNNLPTTDSQKVDRRRVREWLENLPFFDVQSSRSKLFRIIQSRSPNAAIARDISRQASILIANGDGPIAAALDGRDFNISEAGLDSIQTVSLSRWIEDEYGLKLSVGQLAHPDLTIGELAQGVAAFRSGQESLQVGAYTPDVLNEVSQLSKVINIGKSNHEIHERGIRVTTVFLTGGTGFLGIEILRQLLCEYMVKKVIVHARAKSMESGKSRLVSAAKKAKWWSGKFDDALEVWPGDLSQVKLGLSNRQWNRLTGRCADESAVDAIIHNGAAVQWNHGYHTLKGQNTVSTVQLLGAMAERRVHGAFVFVSGGQVLTTDDEDEETMAAKAMHLTGYGQSKMVSELLVQRFARSDCGQGHLVRVVKPSYIIGDAERGTANPTDYIWRLVKSVIELGSYSGDVRRGWLFVSDVGRVAKIVCEACHSESPHNSTLVKVLDGAIMQDFWDVLTRDFGYNLRAVNGNDWWQQLREHVVRAGTQHCLWPLMDVLEAQSGEIAATAVVPTADMTAMSPGVLRAVRSNIQFLRSVGFLPTADARRAKL